MGSEVVVIRGDDATQALGAEAMRLRAVTYVVAGYVAIDAIDEADWGVIYSRMDFVVVPWSGHPVYFTIPREAQSFVHG